MVAAMLLSLCWVGAQAQAVFDITHFGAVPGSARPATAAFAKAIAAAKAAGGGTVYVPAGHYISGPIELVSHLRLEFGPGSVMEFPAQKLPFTPGRQQGVETLTPVPLIGGHDLEDVTITGSGTLMSSNADWMKLHPRAVGEANKAAVSNEYATGKPVTDVGSANGPEWEQLLNDIEAGKKISQAQYEAAAAELRPSFVRFMNSKRVVVEGVHFQGSPMWTVHLLYTEWAEVRDVVIDTYPGVHTDGIVIDSSRFVHLTDDYIDTGDDGIVIKSGKDADGLRVNRPTEDVTIIGCTVHHAHGAVTIGSETSGSVRNIVATNITAVDTEAGIRIKSRRGRGGEVSGLRFSNWTMRNVGRAIEVTNFYRMEGEKPNLDEPQPVGVGTPHFRDIAISGVTIEGAKELAVIQGLPESPIEGLRLTDVVGVGKTGLTASYVDGLELTHVDFSVETGPAFRLTHNTGGMVDHTRSRSHPAGTEVIEEK
jgi:polygalacturonase